MQNLKNFTTKKYIKERIAKNEMLTCNDSIALKPEKGHSKESYDKIISKLKTIEILQRELKIKIS